jgi:hypothetical protein
MRSRAAHRQQQQYHHSSPLTGEANPISGHSFLASEHGGEKARIRIGKDQQRAAGSENREEGRASREEALVGVYDR